MFFSTAVMIAFRILSSSGLIFVMKSVHKAELLGSFVECFGALTLNQNTSI